MYPVRYFAPRYFPTRYFVSEGAELIVDTTFIFKRNTNIFVSKSDNAGADDTNTVLLNVKDFSFNVGSITEEVHRSTLSPTERRGVDPYIVAVTPVEFSFTTYILPLENDTIFSPEEYFWISLMGSDTIGSGSSSATIDFSNGNVQELQNLTLWFKNPGLPKGSYRLDNAVIDSARIDLNIGQISEIQWTGRALTMVHDTGIPTSYIDRTSADNYLKNKLSVMTLEVDSTNYNLPLTGGSIEINNNNVFYGRTKIGEVTVPVGSYTGRRTISGNLNFYMRTGTNGSIDLFNELLANIDNVDYEDTHYADINISIGGNTVPNVEFNIPQTILELAQQGFDDVVSVTVPFSAKEETGNYTSVTYQY